MPAPTRVASLLPSATEMVCAVGARKALVGVSHECDFPSDVVGLPVLTKTRKTFPQGSGAIDRAVREVLAEALTVYEVEVDRLAEVDPQVIVTQALCDVCAVSLDDVQRALDDLARNDVVIVNCEPTRLADVWNDVRRVGVAVGHAEQGERVAGELAARCAAIGERAAAADSRPSVLTVEWLDPIMVGGTWMPELVTLAGGEALVTSPGDHAPTLDIDALAALDPDVVLIKPCGYGLDKTAAELDLLGTKLPWKQWSAARDGRVFVADGNQFFNRPGPRLVESLEILAACVHPTLFPEFAEKHAPSFRRVAPDLALQAVSAGA